MLNTVLATQKKMPCKELCPPQADEYHQLMEADDTVIIDVRNAYESAIGHFQPPQVLLL